MLTIAYARPADFLACVPFDCAIDPELILQRDFGRKAR